MIDFFRLDAATGRGRERRSRRCEKGRCGRVRRRGERLWVIVEVVDVDVGVVEGVRVVDGADSLSSGRRESPRRRRRNGFWTRWSASSETAWTSSFARTRTWRARGVVGGARGLRDSSGTAADGERGGRARDGETTHRNNAWRAEGAARRSRATFALTELGARLESRG